MGKRLTFGTSGLRGVMGPGFCRINDLVVIQVCVCVCVCATCGHSSLGCVACSILTVSAAGCGYPYCSQKWVRPERPRDILDGVLFGVPGLGRVPAPRVYPFVAIALGCLCDQHSSLASVGRGGAPTAVHL